MHGWMDAWMHGWMNGRMNAWMHWCMDALMHGCMDEWMHGCMDEWMHGCMDGCMDALMHECRNAWMNGCMDTCMNGCIDAWMHGCIDAWMHGCSCCTKYFNCSGGSSINLATIGVDCIDADDSVADESDTDCSDADDSDTDCSIADERRQWCRLHSCRCWASYFGEFRCLILFPNFCPTRKTEFHSVKNSCKVRNKILNISWWTPQPTQVATNNSTITNFSKLVIIWNFNCIQFRSSYYFIHSPALSADLPKTIEIWLVRYSIT